MAQGIPRKANNSQLKQGTCLITKRSRVENLHQSRVVDRELRGRTVYG